MKNTIADVLRTAVIRQIAFYFLAFIMFIVVVFAAIYWQAEAYEVAQIDRSLEEQLLSLRSTRLDETLRMLLVDRNDADVHAVIFGLFNADGRAILGDLTRLPPNLPIDGHAHSILSPDGNSQSWPGIHAAAARLQDRRILVIQRDLRQLAELRSAVLLALVVGILPTLGASILVGVLLGSRTLRRARTLHRMIDRIMQGNVQDRLPSSDSPDDFDRLATSINRMLDLIQSLLVRIQGVGDDIAHDLRTPLTRVRARLESGGRLSRTKAELDASVDAAIRGLDQAIAITTSLLRITEIEDGRRRAAFTTVDLTRLANDLFELYLPIAEARDMTLDIATAGSMPIWGDQDLLMEAVSNVVDNAIKFTPAEGRVTISTFHRAGVPVFRVTDTGPGIPPEEREAVMRRFYRSDKSRHLPGSGLGLGLVAAITKLHGFDVNIDSGQPGCIFEICCIKRPDQVTSPIAASTILAEKTAS